MLRMNLLLDVGSVSLETCVCAELIKRVSASRSFLAPAHPEAIDCNQHCGYDYD